MRQIKFRAWMNKKMEYNPSSEVLCPECNLAAYEAGRKQGREEVIEEIRSEIDKEINEARSRDVELGLGIARGLCRKALLQGREEVIELAEREKQPLYDFLVNVGAPDKWCVHQEKEEITKKVINCKICGKTVK